MGFKEFKHIGKTLSISDTDTKTTDFIYGWDDVYGGGGWGGAISDVSGGYNTDITKTTKIIQNDGTVKSVSTEPADPYVNPTGDMNGVVPDATKVIPVAEQSSTEDRPPVTWGNIDPYDPSYSIPETPAEKPVDTTDGEKDKKPTEKSIYERYTNLIQLKNAYIAGDISEAQIQQWFGMYGINEEAQGMWWDSLKPVDTGEGEKVVDGTTETTTEITEETPALTNTDGEQIFTSSSYSSVPWSPIYNDFLRKNFGGASNPYVYADARNKGLGNDPLQRTVYTQFLVQATEDDPHGGQLQGSAIVNDSPTGGRSYSWSGMNQNSNVFANFLDTYEPLTGSALTNKIDEVITTLQVPDETWGEFDPAKEGTYSSEQLRDFRWRDRFGFGSRASQNQQALAALPIMQNTPALLRSETSAILGRMHDRWMANPNKDANEGWLEFVARNNYFGMIGEQDISGKNQTPDTGDVLGASYYNLED